MTARLFSRFLCCGILATIIVACAPRQRLPREVLPAHPPEAKKTSEAALMRLAEDLFSQNQFAGAADRYQQILTDFPGSPVEREARYRLALCYERLDQPAQTVETLRQLIGLDLPPPRQVKIFTLLAESYLKLAQPFDALRWYLEALEAAETDEIREETRHTIRQVLSERLSQAELREIAFIYRRTYLGGYARFLLARYLLETGKVELSRQMISEVLRFHSQEDFFPDVEAFVEELEGFVPDEYVLGCILPLTGKGAAIFGQPSLNGIELAIHAFEPDYTDLNLRLVVKDSKSSPQEAVRAVEELVFEEGVLAIVGPLFRATSEAAAQRAEELGVPLITLTTKEDITREGDFVFRIGLSYPLQIRALVTHAMDELKLYRFAVFYPDDGYGKTLTSLFIEEVYRQGGDVVALETYGDKQMDFGREIKRMVKIREEEAGGRDEQTHYDPLIDFDAIFIPDHADRVALIAPQLAYYNVYGVTLLGTNTWNNPDLLEKAGKFVQGAFLVDEFFKDSRAPAITDFVYRFRRTFAKEPNILTAQAYDATRILVSLLEDHPIISREAMRKELAEIERFAGVSGFNGFDPTGNARKEPFLLTIEQKGFVEVSSRAMSTLNHE
jgi:branched-chain amino acid transport system substrate-binding protein